MASKNQFSFCVRGLPDQGTNSASIQSIPCLLPPPVGISAWCGQAEGRRGSARSGSPQGCSRASRENYLRAFTMMHREEAVRRCAGVVVAGVLVS